MPQPQLTTPIALDDSAISYQADPGSATLQPGTVPIEEASSSASRLVDPGMVHSPLGYDRRTPPPRTHVGGSNGNISQFNSGPSTALADNGLYRGIDYSSYRGNDQNGGFDDSWGEQQIKKSTTPSNLSQQTLDRTDKSRISSGSSGSGRGGSGRKPPRPPNSGAKPFPRNQTRSPPTSHEHKEDDLTRNNADQRLAYFEESRPNEMVIKTQRANPDPQRAPASMLLPESSQTHSILAYHLDRDVC